MTRASRFSPEVRERAVRLVVEHAAAHESQWAAITSIAEKIGCTAETLRKWVRQAGRDDGRRPGLTTEERQRLKQLERETSSCAETMVRFIGAHRDAYGREPICAVLPIAPSLYYERRGRQCDSERRPPRAPR